MPINLLCKKCGSRLVYEYHYADVDGSGARRYRRFYYCPHYSRGFLGLFPSNHTGHAPDPSCDVFTKSEWGLVETIERLKAKERQ